MRDRVAIRVRSCDSTRFDFGVASPWIAMRRERGLKMNTRAIPAVTRAWTRALSANRVRCEPQKKRARFLSTPSQFGPVRVLWKVHGLDRAHRLR